jgi:hypothetical protein
MSTSNNNGQGNTQDRQRRYTNAVLTVVACLLGVNVLSQSGMSPVSTALAQQSGGGEEGLVSAAEQRKVIIGELRQMSARLERMESAMSKGLNVKVIDMPPVRMQDQVPQPKEARKAGK